MYKSHEHRNAVGNAAISPYEVHTVIVAHMRKSTARLEGEQREPKP